MYQTRHGASGSRLRELTDSAKMQTRSHRRRRMGKWIGLLGLLILSWTVAFPAEASVCRTIKDHHICILSIKRSAKYYWQYRAAVSIDGVKRPVEIYNCRDRTRIRQDGVVVSFEPDGAGELICSFF
ncbi:hypothetical protein [Coleofasciculus sp. G2-EDA-02]|uniref:hypothetical protein n=1 Tax=Coleofasciculus sp. G2-EDA-02 TaxID=3069529 RepID=UPI004063987D